MNEITITAEQSGKRLDKFLLQEFLSMSGHGGIKRADVIRNIKSGNILVNGKKVKQGYELRENDVISGNIVIETEELRANPNIKLDIIFEDENLIAINKPAGLQTHPSINEKENTLINAVIAKYPEIIGVHDDSTEANMRPGVVQRLDKDTSGVIVIAKNQKSFNELKKLFASRQVSKKYLALTLGKFDQLEGVIDKPLAKSSNYSKQVIANNKTKTTIRNAVTEYKVTKEFENYSLLEVTPKTGRTHQIRIHLASIGHPILGEKIYSSSNFVDSAPKAHPPLAENSSSFASVKRQMLHAWKLEFELFGKEYAFEAPISEDFKKLL